MERDGTRCHTFAFAEKSSSLFGEIYQIYESACRGPFKQDKHGANGESMLALSVHPQAIAGGFASSVGGPKIAVERDFTGSPVAKVAFLFL